MVLLTEHMLFYASEKYPGEHEYSKYITEVHSIHQFQSKGGFICSFHFAKKKIHPLSSTININHTTI